MSSAFKCTGLVKTYPGFQLGPLSFELSPGTVLGYIGPNGSGKTTTMYCLTGLVKHDGGDIEIFGRRNDQGAPGWKLDIGFVGETQSFYESWPGAKNLRFLSRFYPNWSDKAAADMAGRFDIDLDKKVNTLSRGNRVKLALIAALAHSPRLLLLDEPTAGLDPVVRSEVLDMLFEGMMNEDRAIFYSTHILSDIGRLADELAFLHEGRITYRAEKENLTGSWRKISFRFGGEVAEFEAAESHLREGNEFQVISSDGQATLRHLREIGAENIQENRMSIDEIAVQILKGGRDAADS